MSESTKAPIKVAHDRDKDAMYALYTQFTPLIRKYGRMLGYDGADSDLTIFFIELIYGISDSQIQHLNEGQLVLLIQNSLRNKATDLHRKACRKSEEQRIPEGFDQPDTNQYYSTIFFDDMLKDLTLRQKRIIRYKLLYGLSDMEIGKIFSISRQAVGRIYKKALNKLRQEFEKK